MLFNVCIYVVLNFWMIVHDVTILHTYLVRKVKEKMEKCVVVVVKH